MHLRPLQAILLVSTLLVVQTAAPWLHVGCQHAHVSVGDAGHHHHSCSHHRHTPQKKTSDRPQVDHHHPAPDHDCAACRHLSLRSLVATAFTCQLSSDEVTLPPALRAVALEAEIVGLYRSRAPPRLS